MSEQEINVEDCPDCDQRGRYDPRVHIGGRGVYRCPNGHLWQDAREVPSDKGYEPLPGKDAPMTPHGRKGDL
jgi:hypothetical protein